VIGHEVIPLGGRGSGPVRICHHSRGRREEYGANREIVFGTMVSSVARLVVHLAGDIAMIDGHICSNRVYHGFVKRSELGQCIAVAVGPGAMQNTIQKIRIAAVRERGCRDGEWGEAVDGELAGAG
jgi:hypothetical protein